MSPEPINKAPSKILVVGGGYVGMYTVLRLQRRLRKQIKSGEVVITVVDPQPYMTYQPFLPEAAAGSLEPRHVVVPLRKVLKRAVVLSGRVTKVEHARKTATVERLEGGSLEVPYDVIVMAPGSVARTLPIPGLSDVGIGFKTVGEAIYLRNHVLTRLDVAGSTEDPALRKRALTFVVIGGGYAGIEAFAELEDMARDSLRYHPTLTADDMRWVLVEASQRILPEVSAPMGVYTADVLRKRNMDLRLQTRVESLTDGHVELSDGEKFESDTIIWTAGVKPNPVLGKTDLTIDDRGRLVCLANLSVKDMAGAFSGGDCAAVPDKTKDDPDALCGPSAQHAVRQAKVLADNIVRLLAGKPMEDYEHAYAGSVASLGLGKGVAEVYGIRLKGWPAWAMHRAYHMSRVPTFNRKVRVVADWSLALFFHRESVSLGALQDPRSEFIRASQPPS